MVPFDVTFEYESKSYVIDISTCSYLYKSKVNHVIYVRDLAYYLATTWNSPAYNPNDVHLYYFTDLNDNVLDMLAKWEDLTLGRTAETAVVLKKKDKGQLQIMGESIILGAKGYYNLITDAIAIISSPDPKKTD
jgi:hypothetical protein